MLPDPARWSIACVALLACTSISDPEVTPDAGGAGACTEEGATRCGGAGVQVCRASSWSDDEPCPHGCADGACQDAEACAVTTPCGEPAMGCCARAALGGAYAMGRGEDGPDAFVDGLFNEVPEHPATIAAVELERFEVTVARFRAFAASYAGPPAVGAGAHPALAASGWQAAWNLALPADRAALEAALACDPLATYAAAPSASDSRPINCLTWYELFAYCASIGARVPTEAEWELAAAGADDRLYPWGAAAPTEATAGTGCLADGVAGCLIADLAPVGTLALDASPDGVRGLAGGVSEWTLDYHDGAWYAGDGASCADCANLAPPAAESRVLRGGNFRTSTLSDLRGARRNSAAPTTRDAAIGGRCVR